MKQILVKVISITLVFTFVIASLNLQSVKASVSNVGNEKEELATVLEALYDKGQVFNDNGVFIGFDKKIVKKEILSKAPNYSYLIDELEKAGLLIDNKKITITPFALLKENPKWVEANNACITSSLNSSYGPAAVTAGWEAIKDGNFKKGAKQMLKMGAKGSLPGILITLGWTISTCGEVASEKYDRFL